jgi:hypothetical protein
MDVLAPPIEGMPVPLGITPGACCLWVLKMAFTGFDVHVDTLQTYCPEVLPYCADRWSIGPGRVKQLENTQLLCLRPTCGDRSWGPKCTPYAERQNQRQVSSIQNLTKYHRLRWLEKVCLIE